MLRVSNLKIQKLNGKTLVENLSFVLNEGDRIAVIGEEGNGKSSLLKILAGEKVDDYLSFEGEIENKGERIGYLKQFLNKEEEKLSIKGFFEQSKICNDKFADFYYLWSYFNLAKEPLEINQQIGLLSGGEKIKVQIIKLLLQEPSLIILDEPTNDLDLRTLIWLEEFIKDFKGGVIFVSHDETLLENTANAIIHLEQLKRKQKAKTVFASCTYRQYLEKRSLYIDRQNKLSAKEQKERQKKQEILRRLHSRVEFELNQAVRSPTVGRLLAKKMRNIKAQEKRLEKNKPTEKIESEEAINIFFDPVEKIPPKKRVIEFVSIGMSIGERELCENVEFSLYGPEKVVIIGDNGVGKTTLIYKLLKVLSYTPGIIVAYMPQNYNELLAENYTPTQYLSAMMGQEKETITKIHQYLGACKFLKEEMDSKIANLSGGQRAKLALIALVLSQANVLVLDEPTRNLSPLSNPIIRKILKNYRGAIISVSHDRKYIEEVADTIYELTKEGLKKLI
ncbi:MAG: ABC-F family ATP-binding cassette domain-containing protein [Bacilli bacterium]|jgi:ATPase subunit of ABC transporter with duplicated ATPase domains